MTDFLWPTSVIPARSEVMLRDLSTRFASPFTGTTRTYSRPGGELLGLTLTLPPMKDAQSAALRGLLAKLRGGVNRVWCRDHSYVKRGSFPAVELAGALSGYTPVYATATVTDGIARVVASAHSAGEAPQITATGIAVTNGAAYTLRAAFDRLSTSTMSTGPALSAGGFASAYSAGTGLKTASLIVSSATAQIYAVTDSTGLTAATGDFADIPYVSLSRCALIAGGSQTGVHLNVDQLPTSTIGLLLEGDQVQIGDELVTVAAPLNSDGSGAGKLVLSRPLRSTPADNAPVIIHEPMGLFMLAESENGWMNEPGRMLNASVNLIEAPR